MTDCQRLSFLASRLGLNRKQAVYGSGGKKSKERFKGNWNFLGGCKEGGFE